MATIIKKGSTKEVIAKLLQNVDKTISKGFDAKKFCGTMKLDDDALIIQKRLRHDHLVLKQLRTLPIKFLGA